MGHKSGNTFVSDQFVPHMPLTDADILALQPRQKPYKVFIGDGIFLHVRPNGKKYWRLRYWLEGREYLYSLGVFPKVSVDAAKAARASAKALIRRGINPSAARREARIKAASSETVLRLALSVDGALTIETDANALTLTFPQTRVLAAFLASRNEKEFR